MRTNLDKHIFKRIFIPPNQVKRVGVVLLNNINILQTPSSYENKNNCKQRIFYK